MLALVLVGAAGLAAVEPWLDTVALAAFVDVEVSKGAAATFAANGDAADGVALTLALAPVPPCSAEAALTGERAFRGAAEPAAELLELVAGLTLDGTLF